MLPLTLSGRRVSSLVFAATALWYGALRHQPVRIVVVRDPRGCRRDEAFFCTDLRLGAAGLLEGYARRWAPEVSFHDQKQFPGFEDPQSQTARAVARTAPLAGLAYDLGLLRAALRAEQGLAPGWPPHPWYRSKTAPSFLDLLTALRQACRPLIISAAPSVPRRLNKPAHHPADPVAAAA